MPPPAEDAFRLITAGRRSNAGIMLGDAVRSLAVGLAIGLAAAWPTARMFESLLFGVVRQNLVLPKTA